jgi:hypothetical protein
MANKIMIGTTKLSEIRRMMDFWFMGKKTQTRAESEAMVRDILRNMGISTEDDIVMCSKCMY